jgi:DNA-binding NarL/FixJ family response regulator
VFYTSLAILLTKLDVRDRAQAALRARQLGLT